VSSALRKVCRQKEGEESKTQEEESNILKEEDDDDEAMRMGDKRRQEASPAVLWMASFGKYGSPALDRIPYPDTPPSASYTVKRSATDSPEVNDEADIIQARLL